MPANRSQIHVNKLDDFAAFLTRNGYKIVPPKGAYEVLRAERGDVEKVLSFYRRNGTDHVTIQYGEQARLAARFIGEQRRVRQPRWNRCDCEMKKWGSGERHNIAKCGCNCHERKAAQQ